MVPAARWRNLGCVGSTAHFSSPDNDGLFKHTSLFEILDQRCHRLVSNHGILFMVLFEIAVLVPGGIICMS